jgi:hypothetical protein
MVPLARSALASKARPAPFMTKAFASTAKQLHDAGVANLQIGLKTQLGGVLSTARAGPWLLEQLESGEFDFADIGRDPELLGDPIVLRASKVRGEAETLPLPDSPKVRQLLQQMRTINAWIALADIQWAGEPIDAGQRHLTRIFNDGSFQRGGRLFGGFWISLSKQERLRHLRIENEPVASLDFAEAAVRMAYGLAGAQPPEGDLYQLSGVSGTREGVKQVLNAALASSKPLERFPMGTRSHFPRWVSFDKVRNAIAQRHPALVPLFGSALALLFQHLESQVIVRSLLRLREMGVVALPVHDSLLVGLSHVTTASEVLKDSFKQLTGVEASVKVERLELGAKPEGRPEE